MITGAPSMKAKPCIRIQLADKDFHPELWKVAWDGDQIGRRGP